MSSELATLGYLPGLALASCGSPPGLLSRFCHTHRCGFNCAKHLQGHRLISHLKAASSGFSYYNNERLLFNCLWLPRDIFSVSNISFSLAPNSFALCNLSTAALYSSEVRSLDFVKSEA